MEVCEKIVDEWMRREADRLAAKAQEEQQREKDKTGNTSTFRFIRNFGSFNFTLSPSANFGGFFKFRTYWGKLQIFTSFETFYDK